MSEQTPPPGQYGTPANQPPWGGPPSYPSPESQPPGGKPKGVFASLFDFSFTSFVTPRIVKFVYVLATVALGLGYVAFVIVAFSQSAAQGLLMLVLGAVAVLIYLAFIRMTLEFYYALVRMSEDIHHRLPRDR